jgi:hypothetical protein
MAKITDPDFLSQGTEVVLDTGAKTIQLLVAGNLDDSSPGKDSGVTGKALYSFLKEEWKADNSLNRFRFPMQMIYEASFILINGWSFADQQTHDLIRDAGYQVQVSGAEYACIISLGNMDNPLVDLGYYQQVAGFGQTTSVFDKTGELNENIQIFDGGSNDYRDYLKVFLREQGKTFAQYSLLAEQGLPILTYQAYRLPLANGLDLNVTETDGNIATQAPYTGMGINYLKGTGFTTFADATVYAAEEVVFDAATGRWFFTPAGGTSNNTTVATDTGVTDWEPYEGERQIGTDWYAFNRIIEGNSGTTQQIYEFAQYQLRQASDINADDPTFGDGSISAAQLSFGTVNGDVASPLLRFVGPTLVTEGGTYIDNFDSNFINSIEFFDISVDGDTSGDGDGLDSEFLPESTTKRTFPFVGTGSFNFTSNLVSEVDLDTRYTMYFAYITSTTDSTIDFAAPSGQDSDISWTGTALDHIQVGDYLTVSGAANAENDGVWEVNTVGVDTLNATKLGLDAPVVEAAGASITALENAFETPGAIVVNDNSGSPINGNIDAATINWDFDYDNNSQGGRTSAVDAAVVVVAQGLWFAQWVLVNHTITRSAGQGINVSAIDELNYDNPA